MQEKVFELEKLTLAYDLYLLEKVKKAFTDELNKYIYNLEKFDEEVIYKYQQSLT
jgi:hypothetical protein